MCKRGCQASRLSAQLLCNESVRLFSIIHRRRCICRMCLFQWYHHLPYRRRFAAMTSAASTTTNRVVNLHKASNAAPMAIAKSQTVCPGHEPVRRLNSDSHLALHAVSHNSPILIAQHAHCWCYWGSTTAAAARAVAVHVIRAGRHAVPHRASNLLASVLRTRCTHARCFSLPRTAHPTFCAHLSDWLPAAE